MTCRSGGVHPAGTAYASGGEDGYVRVHHFDKSYFDFMYEVGRSSHSVCGTWGICPKSFRLVNTCTRRIPTFFTTSIDVHPAGTAYASGGEDGYVRVHHFDKSYFDFMYIPFRMRDLGDLSQVFSPRKHMHTTHPNILHHILSSLIP
jgi:hypothetical protein